MKTYICHFPRLKERINYLLPALKESNLTNVTVINGIDRNELTPDKLKIFSNEKSLIEKRLKYTGCPTDYDILSKKENAVAANFLTHIEIWKAIINCDDQYGLVLEDDAILMPNFRNMWDKLVSSIPSDLDIAYLHEGCGLTVSRLGIQVDPQNLWYRCPARQSRTCCSYIISKNFCNSLLSNMIPVVLGVDHELNYLQNILNANVYWTSPPQFFEGSGTNYQSSIR